MLAPSNVFAPYIAGPGLSITVGSGALPNTSTVILPTIVQLVANSLNYIFILNSSILSNTTGFPAGSYPIATAGTTITGVQTLIDKRPDIYSPPITTTTNAGILVTSFGVICDGVTNDTAAMSSLITSLGAIPSKLIFPSGGQCLLNTITFPSTVTLDFTLSGGIKPITGQTIIIQGNLSAARQQIFFNATASLGTISFIGNKVIDTTYPEWWGAVKDGTTNDLAFLQAAADAIDTAGGGTIDLGTGSYNIGAGSWKICTSNTQHFVSVSGQGPTVTKILSVNPTLNAIYLQHEKYVSIKGFAVNQTGLPQTGIGIAMGGDGGGGTQTNGSVLENISINNFNWGISSSGGAGTSSEVTFISLSLSNCTNGFRNADFNGLDFTFIQLQTSFNTIGINATTPGVNVFGGSSSFNGDDFVFSSNGENIVVGYRSEVASATFATINAGRVTLLNCLVEGMPTGNTHVAVQFNGGHLVVENCQLAGHVNISGALSGDNSLSLRNNSIVDGNNTYSLISQPTGQGPGFRFLSGLNGGARFESRNNNQLTVNAQNVVGAIGQWPSGEGYIMSLQGSSQTFAYLIGQSIGGLLQVGVGIGVPANTIQPTAYIHHVGAGLIKTIDVTGGLDGLNGNPLPFNTVQLIPDAVFTTDTTGNIAKASTSVINQVMTMWYNLSDAKWYPSY